MTVTFSQTFIFALDADAALSFYRDALGLEVRLDVENQGMRWITVGAAEQPDVSVVISTYLADNPADAETLAELLAKGALGGAHFRSRDLDDSYARLTAAGAEVIQPPTEQPWGAKDLAVRDPSGNLIRIAQA